MDDDWAFGDNNAAGWGGNPIDFAGAPPMQYPPRTPSTAPQTDVLDETELDTPVSQLLHAWMTERNSPDIMPFDGELVQRIMNHLDAQGKLISVLKVDGASEEDHEKTELVQMEMERVGWILRSYIANRQEKLMKYAHYVNRTPEIQTRISAGEQKLIRSYQQIFDESLMRDVLGSLPDELQTLDEELPDGRSMVSQPDLDRSVFIRVKEDCGPVILPDGNQIEFKKRGIYLISYRVVEDLVLRGQVELV